MFDGIDRWLQEIGLGEYSASFAEHAIDEDVLTDLTEADLEKIGVKLGHRKKLLKEATQSRRGGDSRQRSFDHPESRDALATEDSELTALLEEHRQDWDREDTNPR